MITAVFSKKLTLVCPKRIFFPGMNDPRESKQLSNTISLCLFFGRRGGPPNLSLRL